MTGKLDEHGILTEETIHELTRSFINPAWEIAFAERDALLEVVQVWLLEADVGGHYAPHFVEKRIAELKAAKGG